MSYFIGNISPSVIISKRYSNIDIRNHGSGNAGTTNVMRVMGKKAGAMVFIMDLIKGVVPTAIGLYFGNIEVGFFCGVSTVIGHIFPIMLSFKGGKGVATSIGVLIGVFPIYGIIALLIGVALIMKTRLVSLGSIAGMATVPFILYSARQNTKSIVTGAILAGFIMFTHRENIKRLINKTERRLGDKS